MSACLLMLNMTAGVRAVRKLYVARRAALVDRVLRGCDSSLQNGSLVWSQDVGPPCRLALPLLFPFLNTDVNLDLSKESSTSI